MVAWGAVFLLAFISCSVVVGGDKALFKLTRTELQDLLESKDLRTVRNVLKYEGALAITGLPSEYVTATQDLKENGPQCLQSLRYPEFTLPDGSIRTTFASESNGHDANEQYPSCLRESSHVISKTFDDVFSGVVGLLESISGEKSLQWASKKSTSPKSFSQLYKKEHIHVYERREEAVSYAAPFHVDNGVLLLITPFKEHPLQIRTAGGISIDTSTVGEDAVLVLIARGLPDWLLRGSREAGEFTAAPHAVPSLNQETKHRTIFARMMIAPMDAEPIGDDIEKTTFGSVFFNQDVGHDTRGDLCTADMKSFEELSRVPRGLSREMAMGDHAMHKTEGVSWEALKNEECVGNSSYCWMSCRDLPSCPDNDRFVCTNKDNRQCCTSKDDEGTGKCADMDDSCMWKCDLNPPPVDPDRFCSGTGIDMYMNGFQVSGKANNNCVILFFESWVLDSRLKFAFGCIGVILLGIGVEGLLCLRRLITSRKILRVMSSPVRRVSIILLFALNIAFGYMAMLVAMTYSVELFLCMVVGLVAGHAIFNTAAPVGESADPCCASQVIGAIKIEGNGDARSSSVPQASAPSKDKCCSSSSQRESLLPEANCEKIMCGCPSLQTCA